MLTLATSPELENRLEEEAAKRGLRATEYALLLIEGLLKPDSGGAAVRARLREREFRFGRQRERVPVAGGLGGG